MDNGWAHLAAPLEARNPKLRRLKKLVARSKARSEAQVFVVEGPKLVVDAVCSEVAVEQIFASADVLGSDGLAGIEAAQVEGTTDIYQVAPSVLASILDSVNPQPVAAVVAQPHWTLDAVLARSGPVLVAVEVRDPGNLGTIMRTAEAAGFGALIIAGQTVDRFNPKVVRASAGSILRLAVASVPEPEAALDAARASGRLVVAAVVDGNAVPYDEVALAQAAVLVGNEPHGLPADLIGLADQSMTIPMAADVESLNVAAATAVICFEAARQGRIGQRPSRSDQTDTGKSVAHGSDSGAGWSQ